MYIDGLIWGITIPLIICLVTSARQQTTVSLVAALYVNGLYTLGPVPPRMDLIFLPRPFPSPWAPLCEIKEMLLCTLGRSREWGWDGAAPKLWKHFSVLPSPALGEGVTTHPSPYSPLGLLSSPCCPVRRVGWWLWVVVDGLTVLGSSALGFIYSIRTTTTKIPFDILIQKEFCPWLFLIFLFPFSYIYF